LKVMGTGTSTLIGRPEKGTVSGAAFYNGMIATAEDVDDAHRYASGLHLSATTFPVALSLGEAHNIDGSRFIRAVAAGYEISSRIARSIDTGHRKRGFHSTGTVGPFGACAVSAVVMNLEKELIMNAFGIAGSTSAGLFAFLEDGASVRHVHAGQACSNGIMAALLAANGMTGPMRVFEAKEGFLNAYTTQHEPDFIMQDMGGAYEIFSAYHKIYQACGHSFPAIDAALSLKDALYDRLDDIKCIEVKAYPASAALDLKTPRTIAQARFSIPFLVGLALVRGNVTAMEMVPENLNDTRITALASKVSVIEDPAVTLDYPELRSGKVVVTMVDGTVLEKKIEAPRGMPENPVGREVIEQKFRNASRGVLTPERQEKIVAAVNRLEQMSSLTEMTGLF
jgi:2-methylcitrate dehydratase PrpD